MFFEKIYVTLRRFYVQFSHMTLLYLCDGELSIYNLE